jgi:acetyl esterase/lipase
LFRRNGETICHDGVVRRLAPDVGLMIEFIETLGLPEFDTLPVAEARELFDAIGAEQPPGPDVGEIVDGNLAGADGAPLDYRLYRPATPGPHPVVAYFHGGGFVFGSHVSDDAMCRDLCVRSDAVIVSVDYRHAPEHPFPAAVDDGFAAVQWLAANADSIGGVPGQLAVAGWSAGANVAAVAAQMARNAGGPVLVGQVLLTPVTDSDFTRPSYVDNADGYVLTRSLMEWFMHHYADPAFHKNPKLAPLRAADHSGLPPALVVTCEFDPLRDEGNAYADALAAAGVEVRHVQARGQVHTSIPAVDLIVSGAEYRALMADALQSFFAARVPA